MHIETFIKELKKDVKDFEAYWMKMHKKDPENWPLSFDEDDSGQWEEQFLVWLNYDRE